MMLILWKISGPIPPVSIRNISFVYSIIHLLVVFLIPSILIIFFYQEVTKYFWIIGTDSRAFRKRTNIVPRRKVKAIRTASHVKLGVSPLLPPFLCGEAL